MLPGVAADGSSGATWLFALVGGLVSVSLTVGLFRLTGTTTLYSLAIVFVGGVVAGGLAHGRPVEIDAVGARAGLLGSLPAMWFVVEFLASVPGLGGPLLFRAGVFVFTGLIVLLVPLVSGFVGFLGAHVGDRIGGLFGALRPAALRPP